MSGNANVGSGSGSPTWWIVMRKELHELWVGGKALTLLLVYTILLGVLTWVLASNSELSLIPPKEMVYETLKAALAVGVFIGVIIGADSISGERERSTLEGLLLTPTSRRQIITGKFLAAASPWPAAFLVALPYIWLLAQGDEAFGQAVLWGAVFGTILTPAFTAMGMFVSYWCNSNRTSLFVGLGVYLFFVLPTQLPGSAQTGTAGRFLQWVNPMQAPDFFLEKILVNNRTLGELWTWIIVPAAFAVINLALIFLYAGPGLRLEAGGAGEAGGAWTRRKATAAGVFLIGALGALGPIPALALQSDQETPAMEVQAAPARTASLVMGIDMEFVTVRAGESVFYETTVTNSTTQTSPDLILAMNIINLDALGDIVDPEDWSPQRTQYQGGLAPGGSATHSWRVNAILDGDYMIYTVAIPQPAGQEATTHPVASPGIHLTVTPFTRLNPGGVLPFAIGGPVLVLIGLLYVYRRRRRGIDEGG
jgi:ABC-2 type transport system permease protein